MNFHNFAEKEVINLSREWQGQYKEKTFGHLVAFIMIYVHPMTIIKIAKIRPYGSYFDLSLGCLSA